MRFSPAPKLQMQVAVAVTSPTLSDEKPPPLQVVSGAELNKDDESDSDARKVPEMSGRASSSGVGLGKHQSGRKRGVAAADKEHKRLKRLLRNRVSAQQARERKKAYLSDLETRTKELEQRNAELEERVSTLQQENSMLRKVIRSTSVRNNSSGVEK